MAVAKSEKPRRFERIKQSFRNMVQEMKKVHWPSKRDLAIYTVVVICVSIVIALIIYGMDTLISYLMRFIVN